jgi:hypothetical protein
MRRTTRQIFRARYSWYAVAAAVVLSMMQESERSDLAGLVGGWAFMLAVGVLIVTIGVPGDDLLSGALGNDLLAGSPPSSLIAGTIGGVMVALLPCLLTSVLLVGRHLARFPSSASWAALALMLTGVFTCASISVALGTALAGRAATALMLMVASVGFLTPERLPLDGYPPIIADAVRAAWRPLPLPHQIISGAVAVQLHRSPWPNVATLAAGAVAALMSGALVLRLRITTGRWS